MPFLFQIYVEKNLCGENLCGEKNDKYEVCRQLDDNLVGQLTTQPLDIHESIIFIRLIFQTSIISDHQSLSGWIEIVRRG